MLGKAALSTVWKEVELATLEQLQEWQSNSSNLYVTGRYPPSVVVWDLNICGKWQCAQNCNYCTVVTEKDNISKDPSLLTCDMPLHSMWLATSNMWHATSHVTCHFTCDMPLPTCDMSLHVWHATSQHVTCHFQHVTCHFTACDMALHSMWHAPSQHVTCHFTACDMPLHNSTIVVRMSHFMAWELVNIFWPHCIFGVFVE
jgi:hypothetical protein